MLGSSIGVILLLVSLLISTPSLAADKKMTYGRIEHIQILPDKLELTAKLDTGAKMSSIDAHNIKVYTRDNTTWVDFEISPRHSAETIKLHYPLERYVRIKNKKRECKPTKLTTRPVIEMKVCVNHMAKTIEINLADRKNFIYPILLGRDAMQAFDMLIDPSEKFTTEPSCSG